MHSRTPIIRLPLVSSFPKIVQKFGQEKTQLFDAIHGVQHDRYLKTSCIIGRNISVRLGILPCSIDRIIYSNKNPIMIHCNRTITLAFNLL